MTPQPPTTLLPALVLPLAEWAHLQQGIPYAANTTAGIIRHKLHKGDDHRVLLHPRMLAIVVECPPEKPKARHWADNLPDIDRPKKSLKLAAVAFLWGYTNITPERTPEEVAYCQANERSNPDVWHRVSDYRYELVLVWTAEKPEEIQHKGPFELTEAKVRTPTPAEVEAALAQIKTLRPPAPPPIPATYEPALLNECMQAARLSTARYKLIPPTPGGKLWKVDQGASKPLAFTGEENACRAWIRQQAAAAVITTYLKKLHEKDQRV